MFANKVSGAFSKFIYQPYHEPDGNRRSLQQCRIKVSTEICWHSPLKKNIHYFSEISTTFYTSNPSAITGDARSLDGTA